MRNIQKIVRVGFVAMGLLVGGGVRSVMAMKEGGKAPAPNGNKAPEQNRNNASETDSNSRALSDAIVSGDATAVRAAIANGADPNAPGPGGNTPLELVAMTGDTAVAAEVAEALVAGGALVNRENQYTARPLDRANGYRNVAVQGVLRRHGAEARFPQQN